MIPIELFIAVFGTELILTWGIFRLMLWDYNLFNNRKNKKPKSKETIIFKRKDNYPFD